MPSRISQYSPQLGHLSGITSLIIKKSPLLNLPATWPFLIGIAASSILTIQAPAQQSVAAEEVPAAAAVNQTLAADDAASTGSDQQGADVGQSDSDLSASLEASATAEVSAEAATQIVDSSLEKPVKEGGGLRFRVSVGGIYDDNIFLSENGEDGDLILLARLGFNYTPKESGNGTFGLSYGATGYTYLDHSYLDAVNHAARLTADLTLNKTRLGLDADFLHVTGGAESLFGQFDGGGASRPVAVEQPGQQFAERNLAALMATATHDFASKMVLNSAVSYRAVLYDGDYSSQQNLQGRLGLGYKATEKTQLGLAGVYGYLNTENTSRQYFQDALLTAQYEATGKLKFIGDAGVEFRQFEGADAKGNTTTPMFHVRADYQMRARTALVLNAARIVDGSAVINGTSITRSYVTLGVNQNLGTKFKVGLSSGFEQAEYESTTGAAYGRDEDYWFSRAGLTYAPNPRLNIGCFYEYRNNDGGDGGLNYETNQLGIQIALTF